jgi:hypothetical protein
MIAQQATTASPEAGNAAACPFDIGGPEHDSKNDAWYPPGRRRMTLWALLAVAAAAIKLASVVTAAPATINGSQVVQLAPTKELQD